MTKIFIVYEIKGQNGFVPFIYTKSTIDTVLMESLKKSDSIDLFPEIEKILSKDILNNTKYSDDNLYLIPIDEELKRYSIDQILTPSFINFLEKRDNFKIVYVNYGITILHPFI